MSIECLWGKAMPHCLGATKFNMMFLSFANGISSSSEGISLDS
jgi:hypothetical protein